MCIWNKDGEIYKVFGVRNTEDDDIEFYLYDKKNKMWFWENVKKFTPYTPYLDDKALNVKDINGRIFVVYGTRENDEETEFLLFYKECVEWFWVKATDYTPYITY